MSKLSVPGVVPFLPDAPWLFLFEFLIFNLLPQLIALYFGLE